MLKLEGLIKVDLAEMFNIISKDNYVQGWMCQILASHHNCKYSFTQQFAKDGS